MVRLTSCVGSSNWMSLAPPPPPPPPPPPSRGTTNHVHHPKIMTRNGVEQQQQQQKQSPRTSLTVCAASKSTGFGFSLNSIFRKCETCGGQGAIECPGCKGSGKNKKNGNIFERWKCYDCQGFGLKGCPTCGKGGLTPEQRGER